MTWERARRRSVRARRGIPPRRRNGLATAPPIRTPAPAAGITAVTCIGAGRPGGRGPPSGRLRLLLQPGEDHAARCGLEDRGDADINGLADVAAAVVNHHHGAVVEVGDALVV